MHRASMLTLLVTAAATVAALAPASASAAQTVIGASRVGHFAAIPGINKFSAGGFGRPRTAAPIGISLRSGVSIGNLGQTGPVGRVSAPTNGPATNPPCIGACGLHVSPPIVWTNPPARNPLQPLVPCASSPVGCGSNPPARVVVAGPIVAPGQLGRNPTPPSPPPSPSNTSACAALKAQMANLQGAIAEEQATMSFFSQMVGALWQQVSDLEGTISQVQGDLAHERQVQDQLNNDARIALVAGQWLLAGDLAEGAQQAGSDVDALQEKLDALQLQLDDLKQLITPNSELLNSATDSYINLYGQLDTDIVTYDITDNCK